MEDKYFVGNVQESNLFLQENKNKIQIIDIWNDAGMYNIKYKKIAP